MVQCTHIDASMWVRVIAEGILALGDSHCALCTIGEVTYPCYLAGTCLGDSPDSVSLCVMCKTRHMRVCVCVAICVSVLCVNPYV